jgi:hypothetical protein
MKALKPKDSRALQRLGKQRLAVKRCNPAGLAEWERQQSAFRHEAHPDKTTVDLAGRIARVAKLSIAEEFKDRLPATGVATWRQLSPIDEFWLRKLLEAGLITPATTRLQLDTLRGLQRGKALAPRHKRKPGGAP